MLEALSTRHNRAVSFAFLILCGLFAIAAAVVGISDNPPGLLSAYLAIVSFLLALVHPWRTARRFRFLVYASVAGLVLFGILHNLLDAVAKTWPNAGTVHMVFTVLSVALFLLAVFGSPAVFLVGVVGWIAMSIRNRRRQAYDRAA